jgi:hypothetical protein
MVEHAAKAGGNLSKDPFLLSSEKKLSHGLMSSAGLIPTATRACPLVNKEVLTLSYY